MPQFWKRNSITLNISTLKPRYNEQVSQTLFVHYIEYYLFHYIKYNMLSKSSKWEMGFVHYIEVRHIKVWVYSKKYSKIALSKLYWHMQIHKQRQKVPKYSKLTLVNLKLFFKRCELDTWTPICIVFCLFLLFKTTYLGTYWFPVNCTLKVW